VDIEKVSDKRGD